MKKILLQAALLLLASVISMAQSPEKFNYQGIARNAAGAPLVAATIGIKLSVHDGTSSGTVVYAETQTVTTNTYGLYNLAIGAGIVVSGTFAGINWGSGDKYLEVAMDPTGGSSYTTLGTDQLLSVPYAMYAANAPASGVSSVTAGTGLSGGTITSTGTISMPAVGTAGTYGSATQIPVITTDAEGRVSSVSTTTVTPTGVASVTAGTGLSGGTITGTGTISMPAVGTAGTYGSATQIPVITTDAEGRVSSVSTTTVTPAGVASVTAGTGLSGGTITGTGTISMPAVGTAGTYGSATQIPVITTDAEGRVSGVTTTTVTPTGVTSVVAGTGLTGGTITGTGTISMPAVGTAGTYGSATQVPVITTDAEGRISSVTNTGITGLINSGTANYIPKFSSATALGNSLLFDNGSNVGLGTSTPTSMARMEISGVGINNVAPIYQAGLVVDGPSGTNASGVYAEGGWKGVYGHNLGTYGGSEAIGVHGKTEGSTYTATGYGVKGENTGTGGIANYGVFGIASGTNATGVGGSVSGGGTAVSGVITSGAGIAGKFDGGTGGGYGVIVPNGISGFGTTTPAITCKLQVSGVGTYTSSGPYYQAGIVADGSSSFANATGIYGESGWRGVYGRNPGTAGGTQAIGVHGRCEGSTYTSAGYGVLAEAVGTGPTNYGIYASASGGATNYAGYFNGNVKITGSISKASGTFLIDHPLDPENKYLYHSFVESPDMMNIYNGNVVTDANGDAVVTLPDYFEALNKDFRYQLTVIGQLAQVYISQEISGNSFSIKSDKPNVKISWQVTGVRHDKYADAHRVVPEVEKEEQFKGHYLHAAEWGQPYSKSYDAITTPATPEGNKVAATEKKN